MEVRVNNVWGTICDTEWDLPEANIVCRALGYGTAERAHYRATYGRGVGPIHYTRLRSVEKCIQRLDTITSLPFNALKYEWNAILLFAELLLQVVIDRQLL